MENQFDESSSISSTDNENDYIVIKPTTRARAMSNKGALLASNASEASVNFPQGAIIDINNSEEGVGRVQNLVSLPNVVMPSFAGNDNICEIRAAAAHVFDMSAMNDREIRRSSQIFNKNSLEYSLNITYEDYKHRWSKRSSPNNHELIAHNPELDYLYFKDYDSRNVSKHPNEKIIFNTSKGSSSFKNVQVEQSSTKKTYSHNSSNNILEVLECVICYELMQPPIFQCSEGHAFCNLCQKKISSCPLCKSYDFSIRCRGLERLAEVLTEIPCAYVIYGCNVKLAYLEKEKHQKICPYQTFPCLQLKCSFKGTSTALVDHLIKEHGYTQNFSNIIDTRCSFVDGEKFYGEDEELESFLWQKYIYTCYNYNFVLRFNRVNRNGANVFMASVIILNHRHHSHEYNLSITGNDRKYSYKGPIWTARKGFDQIERVRDCLNIPENIALFLSGGEGSEKDLAKLDIKLEGKIFPRKPRSKNCT